MNTPHKVGPQSGVHGTVARDSCQGCHRNGAQDNMKVAFAPLAPARVTAVFLGFIDHIETGRRERLVQLHADLVCYCHFSSVPSSQATQKV